jgi:Uma2 family endonuclease
MSPERAVHARPSTVVWAALCAARLAVAGSQCERSGDGLSVRIDRRTVYEPDALVRCGESWMARSSRSRSRDRCRGCLAVERAVLDKGAKLDDYFRLPSVRHYLIVRTEKRTVIHHARAGDDRIETRIVRSGALHLDPPGLTVEVESFFES